MKQQPITVQVWKQTLSAQVGKELIDEINSSDFQYQFGKSLEEARFQMDEAESLDELQKIMDQCFQCLCLHEERISPQVGPLYFIQSKLNNHPWWDSPFNKDDFNYPSQIETMKVNMPTQDEDYLNYQAHRVFIAFILNFDRLKKSEANSQLRLIKFYEALAEHFMRVKNEKHL